MQHGPPSPFLEHPVTAIAVCLVLASVSLVTAAVPTNGYHLGLPAVHQERVDRPGAFGVVADLAEAGTLELVLNAYGEKRSTPVSHGAALFDADRDYIGMIAVTAHHSPDRVNVTVGGDEPLPARGDGAPGDVEVRTDGDVSSLGGMELTTQLHTDPGETPQASDEGEAPIFRSFTALHGAPPGKVYVVVWLGAASETELVVRTDAELDRLETTAGTAYVAGDQDLDGMLSAQAQEGFAAGSVPLEGTQSLGAKAVYQATADLPAEEGLFGFWGLSERKHACAPDAGCLSPELADQLCVDATGVHCRASSISWSNATTREAGESLYSFVDTAPGQHAFRIDHQLDAYEAAFGPATWDQTHAYLTVADASLPDA